MWRPEPESNRYRRICNPLHNHSAIRPFFRNWTKSYEQINYVELSTVSFIVVLRGLGQAVLQKVLNVNVFKSKHDMESILFQQVRPHGVVSESVEAALCWVDRVPFLPPAFADVAYADAPIQLKRRCELPFFVLARLLHVLAVDVTLILINLFLSVNTSA